METEVEADLSTGSQGDAVQTVVSDEQGRNTVNKASTHCTTHRQETDADRMTVASEYGDERYGEPTHRASATNASQCDRGRTGAEAPARRALKRDFVSSARSRENPREEVFKNRIGGGTVDEERSGWGIWGKRFYRDMG